LLSLLSDFGPFLVSNKASQLTPFEKLSLALTSSKHASTTLFSHSRCFVFSLERPFPAATELAGGLIGGLTITPGIYKWSTVVSIMNDLYLDGSKNDLWIFQIGSPLVNFYRLLVVCTPSPVLRFSSE
jgi:hypothetical protein